MRKTQKAAKDGTKAILRTYGTSVDKLATIDTGDCIEKSTSATDFGKARDDYKDSLNEAEGMLDPLKTKLEELGEVATKAVKYQHAWAMATGMRHALEGLVALAGRNLFGAALKSLDVAHSMAETAYLDWTDKRIKAAADLLKGAARSASGMLSEEGIGLKNKNVFDVDADSLFDKIDKAVSSPGDGTIEAYNSFDIDVRPAQLSDIVEKLVQVNRIYCDAIKSAIGERTPSGAKMMGQALQTCADVETLIGKFGNRFVDALSAMQGATAALAKRASSGVRCDKAKEAKNWANSNKRRRLQQVGSDPAEPFYAMTYVPLTRLLWEYRIQEAAHQFCKFYEFKNGGVAPPMCGKNKYYTLEQIQEMRSWRPPVLKRVNMRVLIPTRPEFNAEQNRFYPYVDLRLLRAGVPVIFGVPTWDLAWLKKYRWLFSNVDEKNVPSVYVEAMRLYMPFERANADDDGALPALDVNVNVEPLKEQRVSWDQRGRVYMLPRQTFRFESSMGEQLCSQVNRANNPYHETARCLQDDGSSELCLRERGTSPTQNDAGLLPSLFSPWKISIDYDRQTTAYNLTQPKRDRLGNTTWGETETKSPELNLIADLTVVQVYPDGARANAVESGPGGRVPREAASTCCPEGEYRVSRNKCEKCPEGTQRVLFGYSCGAVPSS
ncbi:hypothetical protein P43SY_010324 [Pythium insidiosum]|uniref:Uncharacterized protein n=1 Tax=Pythium insidiosum TaxID=114742 RepID=A0AAD5L6R5_PYTIN|nr:hypothetical protein P43SY_010324 [Pythium insidiosum]